MTLHVDPDALLAYGRQLSRACEAAGAIKDHVDKLDKGIDPSGVMAKLAAAHISVAARIGEVFPLIAKALDASHAELAKAATYYRTTDWISAQRMDIDLPGAP